ncbi:MAG: hypothetical protein SFH39_00280 [Candidatus Magnetobacterium sp. LHC-1]
MPNIIEADFTQKIKCAFCKNNASKLCDVNVRGARWVGHPPGGIGKMEELVTCDNPICDECATHINEVMDICPDCMKNIKMKKKG